MSNNDHDNQQQQQDPLLLDAIEGFVADHPDATIIEIMGEFDLDDAEANAALQLIRARRKRTRTQNDGRHETMATTDPTTTTTTTTEGQQQQQQQHMRALMPDEIKAARRRLLAGQLASHQMTGTLSAARGEVQTLANLGLRLLAEVERARDTERTILKLATHVFDTDDDLIAHLREVLSALLAEADANGWRGDAVERARALIASWQRHDARREELYGRTRSENQQQQQQQQPTPHHSSSEADE